MLRVINPISVSLKGMGVTRDCSGPCFYLSLARWARNKKGQRGRWLTSYFAVQKWSSFGSNSQMQNGEYVLQRCFVALAVG